MTSPTYHAMNAVARPLALERVSLVDGTGAKPIHGATVLVRDGVIRAVLSPGEAEHLGAEYLRIRLDGSWLMPGLINCHDHLMNKSLAQQPSGSSANVSVRAWRTGLFLRSPGFQALESARNAQAQLAQGVTTVRELSGPAVKDTNEPGYTNVDLRDAIAGGLSGPRVLACRLAVAMTGGHGFPWYALRQADGPHEVRKAVREQIRGGADFIKIMASGGLSNYPKERPDTIEYSVEELSVAREEAHRSHRRITAHAIADQAIRNCIAAGIDTIEHGFLASEESVRQMADAGTSFVPTVSVILRASTGESELAALAQSLVKSHRSAVKLAQSLGIDIGVGTDSRATMVEEMANLVEEYHLPPLVVITAATAVAARICGLTDVGVVAPEKRADLLLIGQDPVANLREALQDVRAVVKNGRLVVAEQALFKGGPCA